MQWRNSKNGRYFTNYNYTFLYVSYVAFKEIKNWEVVGQMLIGIILAPSVLGLINGGHTIEVMSEIGVIT